METAPEYMVCMPNVRASAPRRAFTLIDLLVAIAVMCVLIALLLPSLRLVREATRRVVCSSNIRQQGLGLAMYAEDNSGWLPDTLYMPVNIAKNKPAYKPQMTTIVFGTAAAVQFQGLGKLFDQDYLNAYGVFYCPSHTGAYPMSRYASTWSRLDNQIVVNYSYRSLGSLAAMQGTGTAVVSDGLRTQSDYNHKTGTNLLRADFSVAWLNDSSRTLEKSLPVKETDAQAAAKVDQAWTMIDSQLSSSLGQPLAVAKH